MKPSNLFHDDKSSSKYWKSINWNNKECFNRSTANMSFRMLVKLVILSIVFISFGYFIFTWLYPYSSPTIRHPIDQEMIVNLNRNLSITNSSMTSKASKSISATNRINGSNSNVIYQAGEKILFLPGFNVEGVGSFKAQIGGCNN